MAEISDVNIWAAIKTAAYYGWVTFSGVVTFLLLLIIGLINKPFKRFIEEHTTMHEAYKVHISAPNIALQDRGKEDWKELIASLDGLKKQNTKIQHDVNEGRQATNNLIILLKAKGVIE